MLSYLYAEDHAWSFSYFQNRKLQSAFACWWDTKPGIDQDHLNLASLEQFAPLHKLEGLFVGFDINMANEESPAYRFAELLKLPAYRWISPSIAESDTADLVKQGWRKLGSKPRDPSILFQVPLNRRIDLPRPDLSAREALAIVAPYMARFEAPWHLFRLSVQGRTTSEGRNDAVVGCWRFYYRKGFSGDVIEVWIFGNGNLGFKGMRVDQDAIGPPRKLVGQGDWMDSTEIMACVNEFEKPSGLDSIYTGIMTLDFQKHARLMWELSLGSENRDAECANWDISVDALDGELVAEILSKRFGYKIKPVKFRIQGQNWEDFGTLE
ncbi:MAG: hypothetical protein H7X92_11740 [Chitinophagales bacterium]|nr:hypothetical protein [Hyphomicrobiales bacterium]